MNTQEIYNLLSPSEREAFRSFLTMQSILDHTEENDLLLILDLLQENQLTRGIHREIALPQNLTISQARRRHTQVKSYLEKYITRILSTTDSKEKEGLGSFISQRTEPSEALKYLDRIIAQGSSGNSGISERQNMLELRSMRYDIVSKSFRRHDLAIPQILEDLISISSFHFLKWYCNYLSSLRLKNEAGDLDFVKRVLLSFPIWKHNNLPDALLAYREVFLLFEGAPEAFGKIKAIVRRQNNMKAHEETEILRLAINYCIARSNQGDRKFTEEAFDLYEAGLGKDLFSIGQNMSKYTFHNIINHGLALNKLDWVEEFMERYSPMLNEEIRENTSVFNRARLLFKKGEFDHCLATIKDVNFDDLHYQLDARKMMLHIFLIQGEYRTLGYHIDSFKIFLLRHKKKTKYYKAYMNFLKFMRKAMYFETLSSEKRHQLLEDLRNAPPFPDQKELLEYLTNHSSFSPV